MNERFKLGFTYTFEHYGVDGKLKSSETVLNLMPDEMVAYFLNAGLKGGSQYTSFYIGVYEANRTPVAADTMTTLLADCTESTSYTVTGGNRQLLVLPAPSAGVISTAADPNILVFTAPCTIRGGFVTTGITRGATAGMLCSAVKLSAAKTITEAGESLKVPVGFGFVAV